MGRPFDRHQWRRFGGFAAAGFGEGMGMIGKAFLAGRRLASGELQLVLLALLSQRPRHGYELIKALEERSGGFYAPSPGMVYPALTWLEEMGYASVTAEGARKLYGITDAGREYLGENQEAADTMLRQLEYIGRRMGRVREIFGGPDDEEGAGAQALGAARRDLQAALREKQGAPTAEKDRIAQILREATARIRAAA